MDIQQILPKIKIASIAPHYEMLESDQTFPAGMWRWRIQGDTCLLERATATDWSTDTDTLSVSNAGSLTISGGFGLLDDQLLTLGTTLDQVLLNRSTSLNANTALTSVLIGTPVAKAIAANSLMISNITASGGIALYVNKGSHSQMALWLDGASGDTAIMAASGASVDAYIAGTKVLDYATGAFAFQQATTISTTATTLTLSPATTVVFTTNAGFNAALDFTCLANTAAALEITDATTKLLAFDTRNTVTGVTSALFTSSAPTIANTAATTYSQVGISAVTLTLSAVTGVTALNGLTLNLGAPTINQSGGAVVVTTASTLYVAAPVAGASVTITNPYAINSAGDIYIGANKLKTTNQYLKDGGTPGLELWNAAGTDFTHFWLSSLYFMAGLIASVDAAYLAAKNDTVGYLTFKARDTGVGLVEVARLQGAADPYFQIGRDDIGVTTNAVTDMLVLQAGAGSGNEAANFGLGTSWKIGNASSEVEERGSIDLVLITATNAAEDARFDFNVMAAGSMVNQVLSILGTGVGLGTVAVGTTANVLHDFPIKTITAAANFSRLLINSTNAITVNTGTVPVLASLYLNEPNITVGTGAVTTAATLYIAGAPTEGGTNNNAVYSVSGNWSMLGAPDLIVAANTIASLEISDGTTKLLTFDTRNTVTVENTKFITPASQTLPDGATSRMRAISQAAFIVTLAGATQITTLNQGISLCLGAPTINQSGGAVTMDQASTLHVPVITAGAEVTITANRMISTGVADCFLTGAGVWTDTVSTQKVKRGIQEFSLAETVPYLIDQLHPKMFKYNGHFGGDFDRQRYGLIAEEFPDFLRVPGESSNSAVNAGVLANFALVGVKYAKTEIDILKEKVAELEEKLAKLMN